MSVLCRIPRRSKCVATVADDSFTRNTTTLQSMDRVLRTSSTWKKCSHKCASGLNKAVWSCCYYCVSYAHRSATDSTTNCVVVSKDVIILKMDRMCTRYCFLTGIIHVLLKVRVPTVYGVINLIVVDAKAISFRRILFPVSLTQISTESHHMYVNVHVNVYTCAIRIHTIVFELTCTCMCENVIKYMRSNEKKNVPY